MNDSSASNIPMVGHRRWQLNPRMGKVGYGYAYNPNSQYGTYTCQKVFDSSATPGDYDFISWPATGYFMNNSVGFAANTPWSVTLNPNKYSTPVKSDITVTLTRTSDSKTLIFRGTNSYTAADSGMYFNVNTAGYGVSNCIIFRPDSITKYEGEYTVNISGIKNKSGQAVEFNYRVDFFDPTTVVAPTPTPVPTPTAVPTPSPTPAPFNATAIRNALNVSGGSLTFTGSQSYNFIAVQEGGRSIAKSSNGGIHSTTASVSTVISMQAGETLSFEYKYSSENNYDWYNFKVNGTQVQHLSGTNSTDWNTYTYTAASAGSNTFLWEYKKDGSVNKGDDCVKLDNVSYSGDHAGASVQPDTANAAVNTRDAAIGSWKENAIDSGNVVWRGN